MKFSWVKLPWKVKICLVSLIGEDRLFNRGEYTPDFRFESFSAHVAPLQLKDNKSSIESVADYFLARQNCSFFLEIAEIQKLCRGLKQSKPDWQVAVVDLANRMCTKGLPVYNQTISPVGRYFDWSGLKRGPHKDILYLVRPHRFSFAAILSQAVLFDYRFFEPLVHVLLNWIKYSKNTKYNWPYYSNLVVIYRIISLTWSWHFIGAADTIDEGNRRTLIGNILSIINADINFLLSRLGDSHANNHLLADYFIGWFINQLYPEFVKNRDFSKFENEWLHELMRQFYDDGGHFEHSSHYQELCCQMAVIYLLIKRANNQPIDPEVKIRIDRIMSFQIDLSGPENRMWPIGDTTEDSLFLLDTNGGFATCALKEINRVIFRPDRIRSIDIENDSSFPNAFWMLKGQFANPCSSDVIEPVSCKYQEGGFFRISDQKNKHVFLFRTGVAPGSIHSPGHMNSDMLSIFLRHNGQDILIPAGTYSYIDDRNSNLKFRNYLCSRTSQNGLIIENSDPLGEFTGNFRNKDNGARVRASCIDGGKIALLCEGVIESDNVYNGYSRGVLSIPECCTLVYDKIPQENHALNKGFGWQFSQSLALEIMPFGVAKVAHENGVVHLLPSDNLDNPVVYLGESSPTRGWVSQGYGNIAPAPYVFYPFNNNSGPSCFLFLTESDDAYPSLKTEMITKQTMLITLIGDNFKDFIFINGHTAVFSGYRGFPSFDGKMLYIHEEDNSIEMIRSLAINNIFWPEKNITFESDKGRTNVRLTRLDNEMITTYGFE